MKTQNIDWKSVLIFVFVFIFAVFLGLTIQIYHKETPIRVYAFDADINVLEEKYTAINLDKDAIHFGASHAGGKIYRTLNVSNSYNYPIVAKISTDRTEFGSWIRKDSIIVAPMSNEVITLFLAIPLNASVGSYKGKIIVRIYK